MKGTVRAGKDGPQYVYGRKNLDWQGPQPDGYIASSESIYEELSVYDTNSLTLDEVIEDLKYSHIDNASLQKYTKPVPREGIDSGLRRLHEMFPGAALDNKNSTLRIGRGSANIHVFSTRKSPRAIVLNTAEKRKIDNIRDRINKEAEKLKHENRWNTHISVLSKDPDLFNHMRENCDKANKIFGSKVSKRDAQECVKVFMDAVYTEEGKPLQKKYSAKEVRQTIDDLEKEDSEIQYIQFPNQDNLIERSEEVLGAMLKVGEEYGGVLKDKSRQIFEEFSRSTSIVSPLYGDDEKLDENLNDVMHKLLNHAENDFMYEALVIDHARAQDLAEQYEMETEADLWNKGESTIELKGSHNNLVDLGEIINGENSKISDFLREDIKNFIVDIPEDIDIYPDNHSQLIISKAWSKSRDEDQDDSRYKDFYRKAKEIEKIPYSGPKTEIQKVAILTKMYEDTYESPFQKINDDYSVSEIEKARINRDIEKDLNQIARKDDLSDESLSRIQNII